jgi:23S rRNA pseudouridine1911/1915/1917 synthase
MQKSVSSFSFIVSRNQAGVRLDMFLTRQLGDFTRSALGKLIHDGQVLVDGKQLKAGYRVNVEDSITVTIPPQASSDLIPEKIDFAILHEDEDVLVLAKPPGLVVHPAAGHWRGTLAHGLLFHCSTLPGMEDQRPGIVHRLDKDTSGIMLVAKSDKALRQLTSDFRERNIRKTYHALLLRCPQENEGRVVAPVGRHPVKRKKMAIRPDGGRYAATRFHVLEQFVTGMCFVELDLETGRTHQIRVHMASLGCPVAGDAIYGGSVSDSFGVNVSRQLLHASTLSFIHPVNKQPMIFTAPLWPDMELVLDVLRKNEVAEKL